MKRSPLRSKAFPRICLGNLCSDASQSGMLKTLSPFLLFLLSPPLCQNPFRASQRADVTVHEGSHTSTSPSWRLLCCSRERSNPTTCAGHSIQNHPLVECIPAKISNRSLAVSPHFHQIKHRVAVTSCKTAPQTVAQAEILPEGYNTGQHQLPPCIGGIDTDTSSCRTKQTEARPMNWALLIR